MDKKYHFLKYIKTEIITFIISALLLAVIFYFFQLGYGISPIGCNSRGCSASPLLIILGVDLIFLAGAVISAVNKLRM